MSSADKSDGQFDFSSFPPLDGRVSASSKHNKTTLVLPTAAKNTLQRRRSVKASEAFSASHFTGQVGVIVQSAAAGASRHNKTTTSTSEWNKQNSELAGG